MATDSFARAKALGFEERDVSNRSLAYFFLFMGLFVIALSFGVEGLFGYFVRSARPAPAVQQMFAQSRPLPPPPRLQPAPEQDIRDYLQSEKNLLGSSGWIDQKSRIARIPIGDAMKLLLQKGLPTQEQSAAPSATNTEKENVTQKH